jgi:dolichol-phosphate mannosyltransferase
LTARLISALDGVQDGAWNLIYVIEGADATLDIVKRFACERSEIRIVYNRQPSGLGKAFRLGFDAVPQDADLVVTMDADLNHQPEEIKELISALLDSNADIVIGSRRLDTSTTIGVPAWKNILSRVVNRTMQLLAGVRVRDMTSGFRVYRAELLRRIRYRNDGFAFLPEILMTAALRRAKVLEWPIRFVFREAGQSKMALTATSLSYIKLFARRSRNLYIALGLVIFAILAVVAIRFLAHR